MTWQTESTSSEQTEQLGEQLGRLLKGGEVIELSSDLGGGKTTFTRGLARGAGSTDTVASPTFTISKLYNAPDFDIHHFDFYRLNEAGLISHELQDALEDPLDVVIVEWGGLLDDVLPENRCKIRFERLESDGRRITFEVPSTHSYMIEGLQ